MRRARRKAPGRHPPALGPDRDARAAGPDRVPAPPWHTLTAQAALEALGARDSGLDSAEAEARLRRYGPNRLPMRPPPGFGTILFHQFRSPLIYILLAAAVVTLAIHEYTDAGFIAVVLLLNALIGTWQEWKAERGLQALRRFLQTRAIVVRDGETREVDAERVVPGDIVLVESGNRVPADLRLVDATGLEADESLLTGESVPVVKDSSWAGVAKTPLGDRRSILHAGSTVARGRARGLVVATGTSSAIGSLALDVVGVDQGKPPLLIRMERFTRVVAAVVLISSALVGVVGVVLRGFAVHEAFLFVVALAVAAIPEGLPVAMTVALAVATHRMARRSVIVRRLAAVEGLGSCTLIATDKTGTLTVNALTVREIRLPDGRRLEVTGEGFVPAGQILLDGAAVLPGSVQELTPILRASVLCNEADLHLRDEDWTWRGDPTDVALLSMAHKGGWSRAAALERYEPVNRIPFEPELRFAASFHRAAGEVRVYVKGAPEKVQGLCSGNMAPGLAMADEMARAGLRVLAFAEGAAPEASPTEPPPAPRGLDFVGLVGMIDPLRPGVVEAVRECRRAGITVSMVTGDHPVTALAIARSLSMAERPDQVAVGADLEESDEADLSAKVRTVRVFARVAPHQKLQIVRSAQQIGHFVAVTGDGVNDAPALRRANIGIAMGRAGTDVAREASELVITDDDFTSIVAGVEEGRVAYDNIRKVTYLLISTGAAEIVLVGLAVAAGTPIPLMPAQLLWLNLVTNGIQDVALAFEPGERDVMGRPPRAPRERIFNRLMIERTIIAAAVIAGVGFAVFEWLLRAGWNEHAARNALLLLLVLFENIHIGNCRSETRSAFVLSPFQSPILMAGTITAFLVHMLAMSLPPLQHVLGTGPVPFSMGVTFLGLALTVLVAIEIHKVAWKFRTRRGGPHR